MLKKDEKLNIPEILKDLDQYRPRRKGWTWRKKKPGLKMHRFVFHECSEPLKNSIPLPAAKHFEGIDPQPDCVITTEIASGRFEDDIRRMRMAAWHGADHLMVIRTLGQSHFDGLIEGSPEGVGGVPITRKQVRATRKALDMIEDEVGRNINFHSYVSGIAGPEIAVMYAEEGVNGAHQDPQYNVLYRNINMYRSFVDAAVAKKLMADAGIFQIDGAHNANATAKQAWCVMPELLVQHGINCAYSAAVGMPKGQIGLSTVPPNSPPAPKMWYDLPYAVALRELFSEYKMRAQQNTRYMESDMEEATITHVIDTLISRLTSVDIQSTITPDEGRNVPWHYNNIRGTTTAKQTLVALDGLRELVKLDFDGPLGAMVRELKERAVLFMEEMIELGGYFATVEAGFFVDSGKYPERHGDGIVRKSDGGVSSDTICKRDKDYLAPVCSHFGYNTAKKKDPCKAIGGCTLCDPDKIKYIDELDQNDNAGKRLAKKIEDEAKNLLKPEVEWHGDGIVTVSIFLPEREEVAREAALEIGRKMNLMDPQVIHTQVLHPAEGTYLEIKGVVPFAVDKTKLKIPQKVELLSDAVIETETKKRKLKVVGGTVGEDEHSVGMQEILNIKHGGIEKYGFECHYLGTSVSIEKMINAAIETGASIIMISTIITHNDVHVSNMKKLHNLCIERGIRDRVFLIAGGTQVTDEAARECGMDAGFGRGTKGNMVASFIIKKMMGMT
ncbi:MAG: D-ornithine 4,5-aminomutase subunit OraE [Candidatus Wallbacteria bacterium]|nr:D-ornithine 4,5-aminomutase subunit OraE [Candidatus Wallbacteria bacterium]